MNVSSMGAPESARVPRQPRDQFGHLGADGGEITEQTLQRREPGLKVQQVPHGAYLKESGCTRLQLGFRQLDRPRPCVAGMSFVGK